MPTKSATSIKRRSITNQRVVQNDATDQQTHVTTFSLSNKMEDLEIESKSEKSEPEVKERKKITRRNSYGIIYRYPQRYHYTKDRYYSYKYSLHTIPTCLSKAPVYGCFPLRQMCDYNPHDGLTLSRKHKILSVSLPHPKDAHRRKPKSKSAVNNSNNFTQSQSFNRDNCDEDEDEDRNGMYAFTHQTPRKSVPDAAVYVTEDSQEEKDQSKASEYGDDFDEYENKSEIESDHSDNIQESID